MERKAYACLDFLNGEAAARGVSPELERALRAILVAQIRGDAPFPGARRVLDAALSRAYRRPKLARRRGRYALAWDGAGAAVHEVVRSAVDLLSSDDVERLRICADDDCGWLFIDRSRNGSRRWCDMRTCGNRAKARRFYARWT